MEENKILVSIDLCRDYSQIAYSNTKGKPEPESVSVINDEQKYLIPTVAAKLKDREQWCIGEDVYLREKRGEAIAVYDMLTMVLKEQRVTLGDTQYTGSEVLREFFKGLFVILERNCHIVNPHEVVVTVEYPDRILVKVIRQVLEELSFPKESVKVLGHSESLIYYMVFQKRELWVNDVFIFDFTEHQFLVRRLGTVRARTPQPVIVEEMDLSSKYTIDMTKTPEKCREIDARFLQLLKDLCTKYIVSTVYLTGSGFYEEWMKDSLKFLCAKRRVFLGYNLFVKGACYAALGDHGIGNAADYQFVCSGRTLVNIELEVWKEDRFVPVVLSKAGTNWYEAGARAEGILDGSREIRFRINSSISKKAKILPVKLMSFPARPNKTTRVEISLSYKSERQCVIVVKDLGFGEFFKSSGEQVKELINIEDYL